MKSLKNVISWAVESTDNLKKKLDFIKAPLMGSFQMSFEPLNK